MFIKILLWIKWQLCAFVGWCGKIFSNLQSPSFWQTYLWSGEETLPFDVACCQEWPDRQAYVSFRKFRTGWMCCVKLYIHVNVSTILNRKISKLVHGPGKTDSRSASQKILLLKNPKVLQRVQNISLLHAFLGQKN